MSLVCCSAPSPGMTLCICPQDHTGAGLTAAAATSAISGILLEAAVLGSAVNVRVLAYDEAAAVQVWPSPHFFIPSCLFRAPVKHCCNLVQIKLLTG